MILGASCRSGEHAGSAGFIDRLEWIRDKSADDGRDNTISAEQERHQLAESARRTEEVEGAVPQSLIDDAHRILALNENN
ncbi:hypothetical protein [Rhodococcus sp. NPDC127528]|uniref:hypothetical protein n=1 Tax=unclassified Rhodococcus (in: high G+C Gram-positive bacteria) TaxID=192944 RepID=UPI0036269F74